MESDARNQDAASGLLLTAEERERFAAWLERDAAADEQQADEISRFMPRYNVVGVKKREAAAAKRLVASELRSTESVAL